MTNEELVLELHRHFNGDTYWTTEKYKDGNRWRTDSIEVPYTDAFRLQDSTFRVYRDTDGFNSLAALTYGEILEALEEINKDANA